MNNPRSAVHNPQSAIDDALRTYPLAPVPPALAPRVMARIRALAPAPRFRLAWLDYAICLFGTGMVTLALLLWQSITPHMAARMQLQWLLLSQRLDWQNWIGALAVGLALAGYALLATALMFTRSLAPRTDARAR